MGVLPTLPRLAALGFQGDLLGDSGFKGAPFAAAALDHDIHVSASPGGTRNGRFLPSGIRWVVERLFAWLSRYRRLNIVYHRAPDLFAGHVWIAVISIISRRHLDARLLPPDLASLIARAAVLFGSHKVPPRTEVTIDQRVRRQEPLGLPG